MTTELKDLLTRAADGVVERDFTTDAWVGAQQTRRRRRQVATGAVLATAAAVGAIAFLPHGWGTADGKLPAATPSASASGPWQRQIDVNGLKVAFGPTAREAAVLPRVDDRTAKELGLPTTFNVPEGERRLLSQEQAGLVAAGDNRAPVTAVTLINDGKGRAIPVLYRPALEHPWLTVDGLVLADLKDESGNAWIPLPDRLISPDGLQVAFLQPREVVVLDVVTGQLRRHPLDRPVLETLAWSRDGESLVVTSSDEVSWRMNPVNGVNTRITVSEPSGADGPDIYDGEGTFTLSVRDEVGYPMFRATLPREITGVWGSAVSPAAPPVRSVAAGVFVNADPAHPFPTTDGAVPYQGVLVANPPDLDGLQLLLAPDTPSAYFSKGCCRALRWMDNDRVLVEWGSDILLWNTQTQDLRRVSEAPETTGGTSEPPPLGSSTGSFAVAQE